MHVRLQPGALLVKLFDDIDVNGTHTLAVMVMGFESSDSIVAAILAFAFVAVFTVLLVICLVIAKEKRVAMVRELRSDKMPELTLRLGLTCE